MGTELAFPHITDELISDFSRVLVLRKRFLKYRNFPVYRACRRIKMCLLPRSIEGIVATFFIPETATILVISELGNRV